MGGIRRGIWIILFGLSVAFANAQEIPEDHVPADTLRGPADTAGVPADTGVSPDTITKLLPPTAPVADSNAVVQRAHTWIRRLLFRGKLDASHIGAYASYQLTAWDGERSYGPVDARITVYYLGSTVWQGKDAEWLQAAYQSTDAEPVRVEYDLIVPASSAITELYRVLYRVDRGPLKALDLGPAPGQADYDVSDRPYSEGVEEIRLYSGTYRTEKLRGSGAGSAEVILYRDPAVRPLGIVILGYGDEALTFTSGGSDAEPRFYSPPPPRR